MTQTETKHNIRQESATLAEIAGAVVASHSMKLLRPLLNQPQGEAIKYQFKDWCGNKTNRWTLLDAQTAHVINTVYNAVNEENRAKFDRLPLEKAIAVAWKMVRG